MTETLLPGVLIAEPRCFADERGFFMESWNERDWTAAGVRTTFRQDSHSCSRKGVLRGLHYQDMSAPLAKLVRCSVGTIFDVAVDLRVDSATFGKWFGVELSASNRRQLFVPVGFAHGFVALTDNAEVQYKQSGFYVPTAEGTVQWNDETLAIQWPVTNPELSPRDRDGMTLQEYLRAPAFTMAGVDGRDAGR